MPITAFTRTIWQGKAHEDAALAAIRQEWAAKRREIEQNPLLLKRNRQNLLTLARKYKAEAVAKTRLELHPQREAVRWDIPFTSWSGFLRHEAEQGNETALAVLRSRTEAVEPEIEKRIIALAITPLVK